jgi:EmrB/QacA subfamily drug resistance transporter
METEKNKSSLALLMAVYLAGIFMGALDTGIVTPAREIIQNNFGVDSQTGIWMITIYTLAYAASIPVMGKLADRVGRKTIYLISIILFGIGSLLCGLSNFTHNFWFLVGARAIQAIGGGGIMPIATAEFGTSFPKEKRGMALGLVGAVYGIANIFGSLAGSALLDIFGRQNWEYIFYVNIPITVFIIVAGLLALPNHRDKEAKKIDLAGILIVTVMVLSFLYGLKNINFFNFGATVTSVSVYPYLIAFVVLLPVLIIVERRAQDPVLNLKYFTSLRIIVALAVAFIAGFVLMGIVFIPQFCENALKVPAGSGGYFTMILALLSGVSAMTSGRMLDKIGAKRVLQLGFAISLAGALFLFFVAAPWPGIVTVVASLMLLGLGLGFTMGAPINYMMLENIPDKEASSGLATLSLIRSIGTTIAPAIMVGFIANAGMSLQTNLLGILPNEVKVPDLPYVEEISDALDKLKSDPNMADKLGGMELPDLTSLQTVKIDFHGSGDTTLPQELIDQFKTADVTTITAVTRLFAEEMFDRMAPGLIIKIQDGIGRGIDGIHTGISDLEAGMTELQGGIDGIGEGVAGMQEGLAQQQDALDQLNAYLPRMTGPLPNGMSMLDMIPAQVKDSIPADVQAVLKQVKTPEDLNAQITALEGAMQELKAKLEESKASQSDMKTALAQMASAKEEMTTLTGQLETLRDAIPAAFQAAAANYLAELDSRSGQLESTYQSTLNNGYKSMYLVVAAASVAALLMLLFYKRRQTTIKRDEAKPIDF